MTPASTEPVLSKAEVPGTEISQQRGSTLVVALIMLVLLTLIALSAMKSTTSSIQVVGNAQFREEARAAAQKAIELVLSDSGQNNFRNTQPGSQNIDVNGDGNMDYIVTFAKPSCLSAKAVAPADPGFIPSCAGTGGPFCYWTWWDLRAEVRDIQAGATGASLVVHQGVKVMANQQDKINAGC